VPKRDFSPLTTTTFNPTSYPNFLNLVASFIGSSAVLKVPSIIKLYFSFPNASISFSVIAPHHC